MRPHIKLLDARNYGVPQERKRVIIVGLRKDLKRRFEFPQPTHSKYGNKTLDGKKTLKWLTLKDAIGDLPEPIHALEKNKTNRSPVSSQS